MKRSTYAFCQVSCPTLHVAIAATLGAVVDHYVEFFNFVKANAPRGVVPPVASTDGVNFDRQPGSEERAALLAYLRKLLKGLAAPFVRASAFKNGLHRVGVPLVARVLVDLVRHLLQV